MSKATLTRLAIDVQQIKDALAVSDMISEKEAAALLNIKDESLKQKVYRKQIPEYFYTVSPVNGERFYSKSLLIGLKKSA